MYISAHFIPFDREHEGAVQRRDGEIPGPGAWERERLRGGGAKEGRQQRQHACGVGRWECQARALALALTLTHNTNIEEWKVRITETGWPTGALTHTYTQHSHTTLTHITHPPTHTIYTSRNGRSASPRPGGRRAAPAISRGTTPRSTLGHGKWVRDREMERDCCYLLPIPCVRV